MPVNSQITSALGRFGINFRLRNILLPIFFSFSGLVCKLWFSLSLYHTITEKTTQQFIENEAFLAKACPFWTPLLPSSAKTLIFLSKILDFLPIM